jgi:SAM-dependent methyltransferase
MAPEYLPDAVRAYYDEFGEREWERLERRPMDRVSLELHRRLLARLVQAGDNVLEVGAGPGRFTIEMAEIGASVTVVDISPRQLELNRERVAAAGREAAVVARQVADVVDLSAFDDAAFDMVTAFGGPLSYLFDRAGEGLDQMLQKVRPGGVVAFSVMSRWGALRMALAGVLQYEQQGLDELNRQVVETGDLTGEIAHVPGMSLPHECHLFTWSEVDALLRTRRCELVAASASNYLSVNLGQLLEGLEGSLWERVLEWEEKACRSPGALDAGTHILVAVRKT